MRQNAQLEVLNNAKANGQIIALKISCHSITSSLSEATSALERKCYLKNTVDNDLYSH